MKKTTILLILAVLLTGCASRPPALEPPDYLPPPTAGICAEPPGEVLTVTVNPDIPDPRCSKVTASQKLRIVNNTTEAVQVKLGNFDLSIEPGGETSIDKPFGSHLGPGIHLLTMSNLDGAADIWLVPAEGLVDARETLQQFMQARISGDDGAALDLLADEFREQVMAGQLDPEVNLFQVSNPCWYRCVLLSSEGAGNEFTASVRVYQHWWAGDNAGGPPSSWAQEIALQLTDIGWQVTALGTPFDEREEPEEPHGPTQSACRQ